MSDLEQLARVIYANEFQPPLATSDDRYWTPPPRSYQQAQAVIDARPTQVQENYPHYSCQAVGCPDCDWTGGELGNPIPTYLEN